MGMLSFFGCLLTAYAPVTTFYVLYIGRNAQLIILFVSRCAPCTVRSVAFVANGSS